MVNPSSILIPANIAGGATRNAPFFLCIFWSWIPVLPVFDFTAISLLVWNICLGKIAGEWFLILKAMLFSSQYAQITQCMCF